MLKGFTTGLDKLATGLDKMNTYRVSYTFKCSNCARVVHGANIPKGQTVKQFLSKTPCNNCGMKMKIVTKNKNK